MNTILTGWNSELNKSKNAVEAENKGLVSYEEFITFLKDFINKNYDEKISAEELGYIIHRYNKRYSEWHHHCYGTFHKVFYYDKKLAEDFFYQKHVRNEIKNFVKNVRILREYFEKTDLIFLAEIETYGIDWGGNWDYKKLITKDFFYKKNRGVYISSDVHKTCIYKQGNTYFEGRYELNDFRVIRLANKEEKDKYIINSILNSTFIGGIFNNAFKRMKNFINNI